MARPSRVLARLFYFRSGGLHPSAYPPLPEPVDSELYRRPRTFSKRSIGSQHARSLDQSVAAFGTKGVGPFAVRNGLRVERTTGLAATGATAASLLNSKHSRTVGTVGFAGPGSCAPTAQSGPVELRSTGSLGTVLSVLYTAATAVVGP